MGTMARWAVTGGLLVAAASGAARAEDKSRYTLFNPTPRAEMRELSPDRPDVTESPVTVDAGHFQLEMSLVDYTHDGGGGAETDALVAAAFNVKVGVLNNVDLQLGLDPYVNVRTGSARQDGVGDAVVRLKVNLLGNDGGPVALGVMPFVKLPTATNDLGNDHYEGGLILVAAFELPADFGIATMLEIDAVRDADNAGFGTAFVHTVTLGRPIAGDLSGFVEYVGVTSVNTGSTYQAVVGGGVTYGIGEDLLLDAGVYFGLSDAADDFNAFVGLTYRI
jgi:hypothetical protein